MQPNPSLTAELAALRGREARQEATRRRLAREAIGSRRPRRALSRKVGETLIAAGRRLAGPEAMPPGVGLSAPRQARTA